MCPAAEDAERAGGAAQQRRSSQQTGDSVQGPAVALHNTEGVYVAPGQVRTKLQLRSKRIRAVLFHLQEETLQRCREDEEKRSEITCHFQKMLKEIQAQIEQHSARNDKLCHENSNLTDKLESLMNQCDLREEVSARVKGHRPGSCWEHVEKHSIHQSINQSINQIHQYINQLVYIRKRRFNTSTSWLHHKEHKHSAQ